MDLQPVKGTRDFFPEQMRQRNWLFDVWRKVSLQSGFEEYDTCVLEHEELYIRKAGDEISQQLYSFEDKSGRRLSLRPEMTPSLARMILQHQRSLPMPVRWFSIPQCFRYERMTKGRRREHFQWNADIIGQSGVTAEAEILLLLINACREMGLTDAEFRIFLNDRRILNSILEKIEVPPNLHDSVLVIMDKRDKVSPESFSEMLVESGMNSSQVEQLKEHLAIPELESLSKLLRDCEGITALQELSELIKISGFSSYIQFDVSIVRGLSYYTGPVFEMNHPQKSHRAICGGGRYDSLLSTYGGETIPAVGFGFGDVVILDVLEEHGRSPDLSRKLDFTIIPFDSTQVGTALKLAGDLRNLGWSVECNFGLRKMKKALQQASESGAERALLLFPEELERNEVVVRDMKLREQTSIQLEKLLQISPKEQT
ncbi:MAG: histidine--tRNA ligase [SAR324 cluster bacterium]|nr:histidine--tRNA ligase [SAR324 cluster bacterium]